MRISDEILAGFLTENGHARFLEVDIAFDLRDERALSDRLAEALRHARYRDHQHRPESCAGCREVENAIAAHDKERGR